ETITVKVKFSIDGVETEATAKKTVDVIAPTLSGNIYYLKSAAAFGGLLQYASAKGATMVSGKTFPDGTTTKFGAVQGIDFQYLSFGSQGNLKLEQMITSASSTYTSTDPNLPLTIQYGYRYVSGSFVRPMPFPALDIQAGATAPW